MTKTVWLIELFDAQFPEDATPTEVKVALTQERAKAYALDVADECLEQLLDDEFVDDQAIMPRIDDQLPDRYEVLDTSDEVRWIVSWYEVEVV